MTDVRLPEALTAALDRLAGTAPKGEATGRVAALSDAYRAMQPSSRAVTGRGDVLAYLQTRLPATFAAVADVLAETCARLPDYDPRSLLDAGAGPGTASWAAAEALPDLTAITLLDHNPGLLRMAGELAAGSPHAALTAAERIGGSLVAPPLGDRRFDMVIASYALTELADVEVIEAALSLWARCNGVLLLVEPGRTRDYQRLMAVRAALFEAGAHIVAPCPHQAPCPLSEGDWCRFSVRLPRRRTHMQLKGGTLGYEDEKFSYLVVARPHLAPRPAPARVIRPPVVKKFEVELPLCAADGLEARVVPKRDAAAFRAARKLAWGAALP